MALVTSSANSAWTQPYFKEEHIGYFDLSPDGKQVAIARGDPYSDVVLITNFR